MDYRETDLGKLSLRQRRELALGVDVFEIKLGEEFLMSSLFTDSEIALARLGLGWCDGDVLNVLLGGLGLGYTASAVLEDPRVGSLLVVDALEAVFEWHEMGILPLGGVVSEDPRTRFVLGDFFDHAASDDGFDPKVSGRFSDVILVDIDHSPEALLHPGNESFYQAEGLERLASHLSPGGVFGLWSNDPPDDEFTARLASGFQEARAKPVVFFNPLRDRNVTQTIYLARRGAGP
ncbi:MAG: spermidine synthase [Rhodospirillaceae bacterium]|nr:spermidine synthase [Rhodospirillaceae bacterium]